MLHRTPSIKNSVRIQLPSHNKGRDDVQRLKKIYKFTGCDGKSIELFKVEIIEFDLGKAW